MGNEGEKGSHWEPSCDLRHQPRNQGFTTVLLATILVDSSVCKAKKNILIIQLISIILEEGSDHPIGAAELLGPHGLAAAVG